MRLFIKNIKLKKSESLFYKIYSLKLIQKFLLKLGVLHIMDSIKYPSDIYNGTNADIIIKILLIIIIVKNN